tara:strand:- start:497 stop:760 length:264 start_codon:yes stop_codon:yes gene_type:complete
MNTTENNKLIAEFMGYEVKYGKCYSPKYNDGTIAPMQFHTSWDWLIPMVDKCYQEHMSKRIADAVMTCDIDTTYKAVVEFIKEYNRG